ncbi:hypothetical protein EJ05DRAFT_448078 [Pseudovirgaria hyperparasitica]|uniref:Queuosine 5'-phosphate N-glycosylase/hydrolase n=1 Tax=Pseudovirgaria hyperparasitica TaxID=470096 RepID=A0A6A6WFL4_9PEZI|nr:uncharacterized protein EJ05DRAFT_448078 [Pseudovirgaria hyperparasitica]KAF2761612.1 hypothetical protein EJ05DRAFT_448078 [Pseudovirgaria hyperparasitica]
MSDDEADPELLALLRQSLGLGPRSSTAPPETKVLDHARYIYDNSIDVALDMRNTQAAAQLIWSQMQQKKYSTENWAKYELHPKAKDESTVNFIFTMDLLNFSFWCDEEPGYEVEWQGKRWTGYWSMVAALQRALHEGIPITDPSFWIPVSKAEDALVPEEVTTVEQTVDEHHVETAQKVTSDTTNAEIPLADEANDMTPTETSKAVCESQDESQDAGIPIVEQPETTEPEDIPREKTDPENTPPEATDPENTPPKQTDPEPSPKPPSPPKPKPTLDLPTMQHIFRSTTSTPIPMLEERLQCLHEAGTVLAHDFGSSIPAMIKKANHSAAALVNLLADHFASFRDEARFERKTVRLLKRAQIFVADLWAAFNGEGYGAFDDIDKITMFADYRIPQALHHLGCLSYSPVLESQIKNRRPIPAGHSWEVQIRGCSIWSVELIRREIVAKHPGAKVNAVLLDFFLYDTVKELEGELEGEEGLMPHHRTRSVWY